MEVCVMVAETEFPFVGTVGFLDSGAHDTIEMEIYDKEITVFLFMTVQKLFGKHFFSQFFSMKFRVVIVTCRL
jgi:hypothetical protein